jgi:hypothetical protein
MFILIFLGSLFYHQGATICLFSLEELAKDKVKVFSWNPWANLLGTRPSFYIWDSLGELAKDKVKRTHFHCFLGSNNQPNNEGDVLVSLRHPQRICPQDFSRRSIHLLEYVSLGHHLVF